MSSITPDENSFACNQETPAGPVLHIFMQDPIHRVDCTECGREDIDSRRTTTERIVFDDGTAGHRYLCLPCAKSLGIEP